MEITEQLTKAKLWTLLKTIGLPRVKMNLNSNNMSMNMNILSILATNVEMIKEQFESESSDERETAESEAWDCIEKIRFALG